MLSNNIKVKAGCYVLAFLMQVIPHPMGTPNAGWHYRMHVHGVLDERLYSKVSCLNIKSC